MEGRVKEPGHRVTRQAALALVIATLFALFAGGAARGAATKSGPSVTAKVMVAGLKANHYPVADPRKLTCHGLGTGGKGRHTSFRCVATVKPHQQRRFYSRAIGKGGWLCAGKRRSRCVMLEHGFFPAPAADNQGWQSIAVLGWLQAHQIDKSSAASLSCAGIRSPMTCTLRTTPAVTVVLSYQKTRGGYVETASLRPH
jgi:hypothetical protein